MIGRRMVSGRSDKAKRPLVLVLVNSLHCVANRTGCRQRNVEGRRTKDGVRVNRTATSGREIPQPVYVPGGVNLKQSLMCCRLPIRTRVATVGRKQTQVANRGQQSRCVLRMIAGIVFQKNGIVID